MIIKTLTELAEPDEASLLIRPLDIDPAHVAEGVAEYRQSLIASFELLDEVPESTRKSYDQVRTIYSYGVLCYDLYTAAGNQARLVMEQALRDRFLPFYGGTVTFVDSANVEHTVTAKQFDQLYDPDHPLVQRKWRLKLQSGRKLIYFDGMLTSLLRWAREEGLLGGQRDRWQDRFRVWFRNYTAHPHYHLEMPDDATTEIYHLSDLINRLWGAPSDSPVRREPVAIAWTATQIMYGLADGFEIHDRMPADANCVLLMADPTDHTLGNSFDVQYEMTARPFDFLWGPGRWPAGAEWLKHERPAGDEISTLDRLFLLRHYGKRLYMPRSVGVTAALNDDDRVGEWYLIRADYPYDAFGHQRQVLLNAPGHSATGFCRECPAENIASGIWREVLQYCESAGIDVTPRPVPDIRAPLCRVPRWNELTDDGQWVFPVE
jgi:hypothetical protein